MRSGKSHASIVKFQNELDDDFETVAGGHTDLMIKKAQDKVVGNWTY